MAHCKARCGDICTRVGLYDSNIQEDLLSESPRGFAERHQGDPQCPGDPPKEKLIEFTKRHYPHLHCRMAQDASLDVF